MQIANSWSLAMLLKHIVIAAMIAVSAVMQGVIRPALDREALLAQHSKTDDPPRESALRRRLRRLTALNLGLGVLVLLFTAL